MYSTTIQVIPQPHAVHPSIIEQLWSLDETTLAHGEVLTGKPTTRIQLNEDYILKAQRNLNFSSQALAHAWAGKQYEKESASQLYHPSKTWFSIQTEQGWTVANISKRLSPINTIIDNTNNMTTKLGYLTSITNIYLEYAAKNHERLDEGLSNFAIDTNQKMYYIDDDFYSWDHLLSFTNMVALWLRLFSSSWLSNDVANALGKELRNQLVQHFSEHAGVDYPAVLIEHLKRQFYNDASKACMVEVCQGLLSSQAKNPKPTQLNIGQQLDSTSHENIKSWFQHTEAIAIISDVHANLPALTAVLNDIKENNIKHILCLGDIVGYGPHPSECIQVLQEHGIFSVRGNHDYMVGSGKDFSHGSASSLHVARWTIDRMSQGEREWLANLPLQFWEDDMMLVHGAPKDPTFFNAYVYERTAEPNLVWMKERNLPICFHGHSHIQGMYTFQNQETTLQKELTTYRLEDNTQNLICPGAVGQPRCGISGAEYAIYHPQQKEVTFKRLDYDIAKVTQDMQAFHFPDQLITRLEQGL